MKIYRIQVGLQGEVVYSLNGILHRENNPTVTYPDGEEYWYLNGERHREGGPAVIECGFDRLRKYWYLWGEHLTESEYYKRVEELNAKV